MWQSVNRRVYQQISNKDVDIRGETLHFMQQQSEVNFSVEISEVFLLISTHEAPYSIGNSSRVIFNTTDLKGG